MTKLVKVGQAIHNFFPSPNSSFEHCLGKLQIASIALTEMLVQGQLFNLKTRLRTKDFVDRMRFPLRPYPTSPIFRISFFMTSIHLFEIQFAESSSRVSIANRFPKINALK